MNQLLDLDLPVISTQMEARTPQQILRWAVHSYHPKLCMATAFGAEGCAIISMLADIEPKVHVFNLNTGYQFPETLELRERIFQRYGILVQLVEAEESVQEMENRFGGPIHHIRPEECCRIRKVEPLRKATEGWTAWISAIRRQQTIHRAKSEIVEWDSKFDLIKINPLANWTRQELWDYIISHDVPYNPLHDKGYPSIGCAPCTRSTRDGETERAGRWSEFHRTECGLHTRS